MMKVTSSLSSRISALCAAVAPPLISPVWVAAGQDWRELAEAGRRSPFSLHLFIHIFFSSWLKFPADHLDFMVSWLCFIRGCFGCLETGVTGVAPLQICLCSVAPQKKWKKTLKSNFCHPSVLISPVLLGETATAATPASTRLVLNKNNSQLFAFNVRQVETWGPVSPPAVDATIEQQLFTKHRFTCVDFFHGPFFKH